MALHDPPVLGLVSRATGKEMAQPPLTQTVGARQPPRARSDCTDTRMESRTTPSPGLSDGWQTSRCGRRQTQAAGPVSKERGSKEEQRLPADSHLRISLNRATKSSHLHVSADHSPSKHQGAVQHLVQSGQPPVKAPVVPIPSLWFQSRESGWSARQHRERSLTNKTPGSYCLCRWSCR